MYLIKIRAQRQRSLGTEGVYSNPAFMHSATAQVGNIARITTASGQVWEGINVKIIQSCW